MHHVYIALFQYNFIILFIYGYVQNLSLLNLINLVVLELDFFTLKTIYV